MAGLKEIAREAGFKDNISDVADVFDAVIKVAKEHGSIVIKGFGTFNLVTQAARTGRNPSNGEPVTIPEKRIVKFKAAKTTVDIVEAPAKKRAKK